VQTPEVKQFGQVVQLFEPQSRLIRSWPLLGGVSAQVTGLEIARPDGQRKKMVIRRPGPRDLAQNPRIAADEFKLLHLVRSAGVAVPRPYYLDQSGQIFPTPYLVLEYIDGASEFAPAEPAEVIDQLAGHLAEIHRIEAAWVDLSFLPELGQGFGEPPARLDHALDEGRIRAALAAIGPLPQRHRPVLLHGDFWPGNILWRDGRLAAIIDWEEARVGDPLADLANSRLEILWAFGEAAMHRFTRQYLMMTHHDTSHLPYWDLCAALRPASKLGGWGLDQPTEKRMRARHKLFVRQALEKLLTDSRLSPVKYPAYGSA
jgi:aminoglycoside phosphotransferase (APT) family kinase protein